MADSQTSGHGMAHVVPLHILFGVFFALLLLTGVTVGLSFVDLGELNFIVAMAVATVKAFLVVLFFMHLWWDRGFNRVALFVGVVFFFLFIAICVMDTMAYNEAVIWQ